MSAATRSCAPGDVPGRGSDPGRVRVGAGCGGAGKGRPGLARPARARRRCRAAARLAAVAVIAGAGAAICAERAAMGSGIAGMAHLRLKWAGIGAAAEPASMVAFAVLERGVLRASGAVSSSLALRAVPGTAYRANAVSVAVPVAGSAMATGCAYREFRRYGARSARAGVALTIAGVFSAVTFAMLAAAGAIITGNLAVAAAAAAGGAAAGAAAGLALISLRFPRPRARLERLAVAVLSTSGRVTGRPRGEVAALVSGSLARADSVRLGYRSGWRALACALANWTADAACLACAVEAARAPVPWHAILLAWSAGAGAASFCPVPADVGVVDIVLIAALVAAGVPGPHAVAATLVYRLVSFKVIVTLALFLSRLAERRLSRHN